MFKVVLFYKYIEIQNPKELVISQKELCGALNLKGRVLIATEGINGTLEGAEKDIKKYIQVMKKDGRFSDVDFKESEGNGEAFPKLQIKLREEIVSGHFGSKDVKPWEVTGKHIKPEELKGLIDSKEEFFIVDMRNDFEQVSGKFKGSILPGMSSYRDLPKVIPKLKRLKNKKVVTVCTGGVRCEKASGFLIKNGFSDVYQLEGGIVRYMEKYPNEDFEGSLYVFDQRILWTPVEEHNIIAKCEVCGKKSERYINCKNDECHRHFVMCQECSDSDGAGFCPGGCRIDRFGQMI